MKMKNNLFIAIFALSISLFCNPKTSHAQETSMSYRHSDEIRAVYTKNQEIYIITEVYVDGMLFLKNTDSDSDFDILYDESGQEHKIDKMDSETGELAAKLYLEIETGLTYEIIEKANKILNEGKNPTGREL